MRIDAPAKLNLCLFLGPRREDGLHELCSLFEPLALADSVEVAEAECDEVVCPGVQGENLAARALAALREAGWDPPPLRLEIEKRIPIAAGLGGGSADAAAVLRLAAAGELPALGSDESSAGANGIAGSVPDLLSIAAELGADVPSQLVPAFSLVLGAGERVERLPDPAPHAVVLLPGGGGLSTAEVFAEADRLGLGREAADLESLAAQLRGALGSNPSPLDCADLLANDLEPAARSLRPEIGEALDLLRATDPGDRSDRPPVLMSGSGPTVVGLFPSLGDATRAAASLGRDDAIVCEAGRAP
jgi:4-diphosphocytidyl-2-C-methyl-D-erythritol kinase